MSNVSVHKPNGEMLEVTLLTLFSMLADESSHLDLLSRLNRDGQVEAQLRDGAALVKRVTNLPRLLHQPALPLCDFTADTRLHFALPARIHCRAASPSEARHIIEETIHGSQGVPAGFSIEINPGEVEAFVTNLDIGSLSVIEDVTITGINQSLLIGMDASS